MANDPGVFDVGTVTGDARSRRVEGPTNRELRGSASPRPGPRPPRLEGMEDALLRADEALRVTQLALDDLVDRLAGAGAS